MKIAAWTAQGILLGCLYPFATLVFAAGGVDDCPPLIFPTNYNQSAQASVPIEPPTSVSFTLQRGLLRPQLELLLRDHLAIQQVVWQAPTDIHWPSHYQLEGLDWLAVLEQLAASYQLQVSLFANHIAVVQAQGEVRL